MTYLVEYRGGFPVGVYRSVRECAEKTGKSEDYVHWLCTPSYKRRNPSGGIDKVEVED